MDKWTQERPTSHQLQHPTHYQQFRPYGMVCWPILPLILSSSTENVQMPFLLNSSWNPDQEKFTTQKDQNSLLQWQDLLINVQPNCIQNFSHKQQLSFTLRIWFMPQLLWKANPMCQSHAHPPMRPTDGPSLGRAHSSMSFLALLLHSATSICPIYSVKCSPGMINPITEIMRGIMERQIAKHLANT